MRWITIDVRDTTMTDWLADIEAWRPVRRLSEFTFGSTWLSWAIWIQRQSAMPTSCLIWTRIAVPSVSPSTQSSTTVRFDVVVGREHARRYTVTSSPSRWPPPARRRASISVCWLTANTALWSTRWVRSPGLSLSLSLSGRIYLLVAQPCKLYNAQLAYLLLKLYRLTFSI